MKRRARGLCLLVAALLAVPPRAALAVTPTDAISREVVVQNAARPVVAATDAISREVVVTRITNPPTPTDAISREFVVVNSPLAAPPTDAISREFVLVNSPPPPPPTDAISRLLVTKNVTPAVDPDGDGVLTSDGNGPFVPCTRGDDANCDDNCPAAYNPDQRDGDVNGLGDVCDTPKVIRVVPGNNGVDVPVWANVTVNFSEPMTPATLTPATLRVLVGGVPVDGTVSVTATGLSAVFTPTADLPTDTLCQVEVTGGARDLQNVALARFTSYFRTSTTNDPAQKGLDGATNQTGANAGERLGTAFAAAGDLDGDGFQDWVVGAPGYDDAGVPDRGRVLVYLGDGSGTPKSTPDVIYVGTGAQEFAGGAVAAGRDVDGDGSPDIVVGAEQHDGVAAFGPGKVYLVHFNPAAIGSTVVLGDVAAAVFTGKAVGDRAGHALALLPDVNVPADQRAELLIGAPRAAHAGKTGCGEAYLVFGRPFAGAYALGNVGAAGAGGIDGYVYVGAAAGDGLGWSVDGGKDWNGDGVPDIALGAPYRNVPAAKTSRVPLSDAGSIYLQFPSGFTAFGRGVIETDSIGHGGDDGIVLSGDRGGEQLGYAISLSDDFTGDSRPDLVVGAPLSDGDGVRVGAGEAFVLEGHVVVPAESRDVSAADVRDPASGLGFAYQGANAGDQLGASVGSTPSKTSLGTSDLLLGAPHYGALGLADAGAAYHLIGGAGRFARGVIETDAIGKSDPGTIYTGPSPGGMAGSAVGSVGDSNDDGAVDFGIGAPRTDVGTAAQAGALYIVTDNAVPTGETRCGPAGCVLTDLVSGARLSVPSGALTSTISATIASDNGAAALPGAPPVGMQPLGAVTVQPDAQAFVTGTASLEVALVPTYESQVNLGDAFPLFRWDGATWQATGVTAILQLNSTYPVHVSAVANVSAMGTYAVLIPDLDGDGTRDELDSDVDGDGVPNAGDDCPRVANPDQLDRDHDGTGDACDRCPLEEPDDADGDGLCCPQDNCCAVPNASQSDSNANGLGDACDVAGGLTVRVSSAAADHADFSSIGAAVSAALPGTTIDVFTGNGPYHESVLVDRHASFQIEGVPNAGPVVVDGGSGPAFALKSGPALSLANFTLRGARGVDVLTSSTLTGLDFRSVGGVALEIGGGAQVVRRVTADASVGSFVDLAAGASLHLERAIVRGNSGGNALTLAGDAVIAEAVVADASGDGIVVANGGSLVLGHATVTGNAGAGVRAAGGSTSVSFAYSIVYGNSGGDAVNVPCAAVSWSDLGSPSCAGSANNVSVAPLFDADLHLADGSPLLDFGPDTRTFVPDPGTDAAGDLRVRDFDGDGIARLDLGAYERRNPNLVAEVDGVAWSDADTMTWAALPGAQSYHVYRGTAAALCYSYFGDCHDDLDLVRTDTVLHDTVRPAASAAFFYLITAVDGSGRQGTLGAGCCAERSRFNACP